MASEFPPDAATAATMSSTNRRVSRRRSLRKRAKSGAPPAMTFAEALAMPPAGLTSTDRGKPFDAPGPFEAPAGLASLLLADRFRMDRSRELLESRGAAIDAYIDA